MIIRFIVSNLFSFGKEQEFSMLPNRRYQTLLQHMHHHADSDFDVLKIASLYGANGAGKSNMIKSIKALREMVISEDVNLHTFRHKFLSDDTSQVLALEFFSGDTPYVYAVETLKDYVVEETLYISGLGKKPDQLVFSRKVNGDKTCFQFSDEFESDPEGKVLKSVIEQNLSKPNKLSLKMLSELKRKGFEPIKECYSWFKDKLVVLSPNSKPVGLAMDIDRNEDFNTFANNLLCTLSTGIDELFTLSKPVKEESLPSSLVEQMKKDFRSSPDVCISVKGKAGNDIVYTCDGENIYSLELKSKHSGDHGEKVDFDLGEESDGTLRLLDFLPMCNALLSTDQVYLVDEIERSIHPLLIKEMLRKLSVKSNINGQLIFTTHESNLLDQKIFRKDEIWFAEKRKDGSTDLYSLSDFKEHHSIDISKGYLTGRYGGIPFTGNLRDLNWEDK
ncbi:MAG: ATPase [Bacteroidetes bacterium]|jgi:uncharacterized protein|nr:ATPase [Bacteroidota bacterium]